MISNQRVGLGFDQVQRGPYTLCAGGCVNGQRRSVASFASDIVQWTTDEKYCFRLVSNEVQIYRGDALEEGRLSRYTIQQLTQEWPDNLEVNSETVKLRKFKAEVYFDDYKRDAVIDQEIDVIDEEDNPFGYIRYISESSSEDEITILLPTPIVSSVDSEQSSEASTVQNSMEDLSEIHQPSKKLPFIAYDDFKTCSLIEETKSLDSEERQLSCPPVIKKSQESLFFIDKTPVYPSRSVRL